MTENIEMLESIHALAAQADESIKMLGNMAADVRTPPALAQQFTVAGVLIKTQKDLLNRLVEQQLEFEDHLAKLKKQHNL